MGFKKYDSSCSSACESFCRDPTEFLVLTYTFLLTKILFQTGNESTGTEPSRRVGRKYY